MKLKGIITLTLACLAFHASAQDMKAEQKIAELGTTQNPTWDYLSTLTGRFGGRILGSSSYENTAAWLLHEFKKLGPICRQNLLQFPML